MIDDLVLVTEIDPSEQVSNGHDGPFEWKGLVFSPQYRLGEVVKYVSEFRNLRLVMKYDKLILSGSLHKFYHRNNSGDFTWCEIREVIEQLYVVFGERILLAQLKKLTFACNLQIDAKQFLQGLVSIKGRKPVDMVGGVNHASYGKYIKMTDYRIKVYDKKMEVLYHDRKRIAPTLRLEIELNLKAAAARKTNPVRLYQLGDLLEEGFAGYCQQELLSMAHQLEFAQKVLPDHCSLASDLECLALMGDLSTRLRYKRLANPKTYRKKLKRYQELCEQDCSVDMKQRLFEMVSEKIEELASSNPKLEKQGKKYPKFGFVLCYFLDVFKLVIQSRNRVISTLSDKNEQLGALDYFFIFSSWRNFGIKSHKKPF